MRARLDGLPALIRPWVLLAAVFFGALLFLVILVLLNYSRPAQQPVGMVTAALTVIPAPTMTALPPAPTDPQPTPDPNIPVGSPPGTFSIGAFISVSGTEGDGLRLRSGPGLEFNPRYLGLEGEIFRLDDGPRDADGYTWWLLVAPADETRQGWAVVNYLSLAQNPE